MTQINNCIENKISGILILEYRKMITKKEIKIMAQDILSHWDSEHGVSRCVLNYKTSSEITLQGIGIAECHPDDYQFMSEITGGLIAEYRAEIDLLKKINNYEIKPGIEALKHVYCTMRHSKRYNDKSYEACRIKKELAHLMDELEENKKIIQDLKDALKTYIDGKDAFYRKVKNK